IAKDYVNVTLSERFNDNTAVLMVFDLSGRMVMSEQIAANNFTRLDVSGLTNGHYFVRLESDSVVETARFVKAN
ncbi:MAG: T9SS type A sorting domain-containing protein, partial [Bacteroidota bacterium]